MYKVRLKHLFLVASLSLVTVIHTSGQAPIDSASQHIDGNFNIVRAQFSGQEAFNTVAFMEKYWRIAGNEGFNASIHYVADLLEEAGFVPVEVADKESKLTLRIEKRPMDDLTWEPVSGWLEISANGKSEKILDFSTNRNMIAVNSWSTPDQGIEAELVFLKPELKPEEIAKLDLKGKIVFIEGSARRLFRTLVKDRGALGIITYNNPDYLQPAENVNSIQFSSIPQDSVLKSWAIVTSFHARESLLKFNSLGKVMARVNIQTKLYKSEELTLVADIKGTKYPNERIVYSAHVQEPGANDNASGVAAQAEMARVAANLVKSGQFVPDRTMTFLFGDEIISTRRYVQEDEERAKGIKWGISLDMVGEDTERTGGSFLIEKMPDPSAIWTRGDDKHTEWGGYPLTKEQIKPGYFNDFIIEIFKMQGKYANWEVNTNPFEGGSDHVPFLRANIPGLLLWHFTDAFYHTDGDRLDKVSMKTLENVGTGALVAGLTLVNADDDLANYMIQLVGKKANERLMREYELSKAAIASGGNKAEEEDILNTWTDYYKSSLKTIRGLIHDMSDQTKSNLISQEKRIDQQGDKLVKRLSY